MAKQFIPEIIMAFFKRNPSYKSKLYTCIIEKVDDHATTNGYISFFFLNHNKESYCNPNMCPHLSIRDPVYKKEFKMTSKLF